MVSRTTAAIDRALERATDDIEIVGEGSELGVGTTVTGVVLTLQGGEPYFAVFNIGDSRVYQFERGELRQVTVDHSVVQEMVDSGLIDRSPGRTPPRQQRHHARGGLQHAADGRLLDASAAPGIPPADLFRRPHQGAQRRPPAPLPVRRHWARRDTAHALVDAALAAGGRDNVTTIVLDVVAAPTEYEFNSTAPRSGGRTV